MGVDTTGWMHSSSICCSRELALGVSTYGYVLANPYFLFDEIVATSLTTRFARHRYVTSFLAKVDMLRGFGITSFLVIDGARTSMK